MKYFLIIIISIFFTTLTSAQDKYLDRKGVILFEASEKNFEPVKAKNNSVTAIINVKNGEFASLALIKEFRFKNALMQEHFNENYIESDKFPKATFKGRIDNFDILKLNNEQKEHLVLGDLSLHGVTINLNTKVLIHIKDGIIYIEGKFIVLPEEFKINIPKIVRGKIAERIKINFSYKLETSL